MKTTNVTTFAAAAVLLCAHVAQARVVERIAAVVDDEVILASEVEERAAPAMAQIASITDQAQRAARAEAVRREILDRLIDDQLIFGKAKELKLTVSSEEVDKSIEGIKRDHNLTDEQLRQALTQQGMSMATYRQDVKKQVLRYRVLNMAVGSKIAISDHDVQEYYERNIRKGAASEVRASHIFIEIPDDADTGTAIAKRKQAEGIVARIKAGEEFEKLARENSEDANTRGEGGDLGYFGRDLLPKAIEEVVFAMNIGEVRGPVRADKGFHIIKLVDKRNKDVKSFDESKNEIRMQLRQKEYEKQAKTFVADLRRKAMVDLRL
ncbi:MAG: peptidylprolyl isomerase [Deltaproteobacteria bacterium]|nr:peptidylprolyl isomerase [Deltaproteobacteria bacterium]